MNDISLSLGIGAKSTTKHEEAKEKMYEILEQIVDAGWKRYIFSSDPRICGKEALMAEQTDSNISGVGLDPNYFMNFKEWFSISMYTWRFYYHNEALMDVTLHRQGGDNDLEKPAFKLQPDLKKIKKRLTDFSNLVLLTGSGSTIYAGFYTKKEILNCYKEIKNQFKGYKVIITRPI